MPKQNQTNVTKNDAIFEKNPAENYRNAHSNSRSRKGLSLTQSMKNINKSNRPNIKPIGSLSKIKSNNKCDKGDDPLFQKLNTSVVSHPKRVEIHLY